ncbi:TPA: hypothetical protein ACPZUA_002337 [Yersinia enterocolitica]|uniref:hypothetical protein n=1 Tax=Yersinia kristensenii TaxID=28152 RepID=UPI001C6110CB|nr:hypothetical protein [Yersinia kristensenii]EKN6363154.1 hypothetical protein [Yersinia enterocolitica]EKN6373548.1 hypothetical protein [Yersinia enterocolitica]MBW5818741.1 hypothetical protein [Yersinia kristensenii]MBW5842436.1 hypothetical protein [Yersinia kristensenii]MDA5488522.1 hypothetical protein [Yersinia kristensenii]
MSENKYQYVTPELNASYDAVFIMDFLPEADRNKYKITEKLKQTLANESLPVAEAFPNNREELILSFNKMLDWTKEGKKYFLQFVGHGCEDGIEVGGEIVAWKDLAEHLEEVNALSKNTLLLNMSTCKGINAVKATASDGDYPFFGVIGATENLLVKHAIQINEKIYKKMMEEKSLQNIIPEINTELNKEVLFLFSAEGFRILNK